MTELKGCDMLEHPRNALPNNGTAERLHGKIMHMDNQQATPLEVGWLIGFIEGEGCVGLYPGSGGKVIHPLIKITNTDFVSIRYAADILEHLNVGYHIRTTNYKPKGTRYDIEIMGMKRMHNFLSTILPYWHALTVKRQRAERVFKFCESRLSRSEKSSKHLKAVPYNEEERELYRLDRESPQRLMSSPTLKKVG